MDYRALLGWFSPTLTIHLDFGKLTDWLGILINLGGFGVGIFVLITANRNLKALSLQMQSQSSQALVEAHKTLFMPLVQNAKLAELASGSQGPAFRKKMLASMMINHASRIYYEIADGVIPDYDRQVFQDDLLDMFSIPIVEKRWPEVRSFHRAGFVLFVDAALSAQSPLATPT